MKYIKLKCDEYYCNTEFLVAINEDNINVYFCPRCANLCFQDECIEIIEINEEAIINNEEELEDISDCDTCIDRVCEKEKLNDINKKDNIYLKKIIDDSHKVIALHSFRENMNDASKRLNLMVKKLEEKESVTWEDYVKYMRYIFETSPIKKYKMISLDGEFLGV